MLLSRARRWPMPSMPLTRFFIFFFIRCYLLELGDFQMLLSRLRRQPISSIALTRFFIVFINNTSKCECVLFSIYQQQMQLRCIRWLSQVWVTLTGICRAEYFISKFLRKSKCI